MIAYNNGLVLPSCSTRCISNCTYKAKWKWKNIKIGSKNINRLTVTLMSLLKENILHYKATEGNVIFEAVCYISLSFHFWTWVADDQLYIKPKQKSGLPSPVSQIIMKMGKLSAHLQATLMTCYMGLPLQQWHYSHFLKHQELLCMFRKPTGFRIRDFVFLLSSSATSYFLFHYILFMIDKESLSFVS